MSIFSLKLIACIAMALSHFGSVFQGAIPLPMAQGLYFAGRISFPIFACLLVIGWNKTKHKKRYLIHLFVFALISQIPFTLAQYRTIVPVSLNVLFTLFLGALSLWAIDRVREGVLPALLLAPVPACLAACIPLDFGWPGVLVISVMGVFRSKYSRIGILTAVMAVIYLRGGISLFSTLSFLCTLPGLIMLWFLNPQKPCFRAKYFFYIFYPAHLLLLYMLSLDF